METFFEYGDEAVTRVQAKFAAYCFAGDYVGSPRDSFDPDLVADEIYLPSRFLEKSWRESVAEKTGEGSYVVKGTKLSAIVAAASRFRRNVLGVLVEDDVDTVYEENDDGSVSISNLNEDTEFALKFGPSLEFSNLPRRAFAYDAAAEFFHGDSRRKRDVLNLVLRWTFEDPPIVPRPGEDAFFVVERFADVLASLGTCGEAIRDTASPETLASILAVGEPHRVSPESEAFVSKSFDEEVSDLPLHARVLAEAIWKKDEVAFETRSAAVLGCESIRVPRRRRDRPSPFLPSSDGKREEEDDFDLDTESSSASLIYGAFCVFENDVSSTPSTAGFPKPSGLTAIRTMEETDERRLWFQRTYE